MSENGSEGRKQLIVKSLDRLVTDQTLTATELRICLETIVVVFKNVLNNCSKEKFRRIRTSNHNFHSKVWRHLKARQVLLDSGWRIETSAQGSNEPQLIRLDDPFDRQELKNCLNIIMDYKLRVKPIDDKWSEELRNRNDLIEEQKAYEEMRRRGADERRLELEAFGRTQTQLKLLAINVRNEIKSDIRYRQMLVTVNTDQQNEKND